MTQPVSPTGPASDLSRVKRHPERASYDEDAVHAVLDAETVGHVGFSIDGQSVVIPMLYGRHGHSVYLHGSVASRLMRQLPQLPTACLSVTLVDALVLARSAFHHSMNYRSAVVFGPVTSLADDAEKLHALRTITEHMMPGRWDEVREPSRVELRQTAVLRLDIAEASAKSRSHGVADDEADMDLDVWAGLLPVVRAYGAPLADPAMRPDVPVAVSVAKAAGATW